MKTESLIAESWNDLIFENRNKDYGAYFVRSSYSRNVIKAFGVSVSFAALLIVSPEIIKGLKGEKVIPVVVFDEPDVHVFEQPPSLPKPPVEATPPPAAPKQITNLPPQVTTALVDDQVLTNIEIATAVDDNTGTGPIIDAPPAVGVVEAPPVTHADPLSFAQVMPSYEGGMEAMIKYLKRNLKYPHSSRSMGIEGTVFVGFVVNADGDIVDVKIIRGLSADCDKEAMRVISKMPAWNAGMQNDQHVAVRMVLPIKYQLD